MCKQTLHSHANCQVEQAHAITKTWREHVAVQMYQNENIH